MRKFLISLIVLLALAAGGYALYSRPEIRALFESAEKQGDPLDFLEDLPEVTPKPPPQKQPSASERQAPNTTERAPSREGPLPSGQEAAPDVQNQVPNDEVAHVMMAILAAKKLGRHLSISVTDDQIIVYGEVDSAQEKQQIREILEKGRETREVNTDHLTIQE